MANEYLQRTPTSTGNRKVWTWSGWVKRNTLGSQMIYNGYNGSTLLTLLQFNSDNTITFYFDPTVVNYRFTTTQSFRDISSWMHIVLSINTTNTNNVDRAKLYVNGVQITSFSQYDTFPSNFDSHINFTNAHNIGRFLFDGSRLLTAELSDIFLVDGQALTPDVFGFYKEGKGYISAGSTQATDFRPGQWVPKTPRVIKTEINRRGGFGVNGFYLPMNDSSNFGADFHCTPNSIIKLKGEDLPQPRNGAPTTTDAYVSQLRTDPYAANLVLAVPGISGGTSSGFGDYSATIKGSGSNKTLTANGNAGIAVTASYYGSALSFDGSGDYFTVPASSDLDFGTGDFTAEFWLYSNSSNSSAYRRWLTTTSVQFGSGTWVIRESAGGSDKSIGISSFTTGANAFQRGQWNHIAWTRYGNTETIYVNGAAAGIGTNSMTNYNEGGTNGLYIGGFYATSNNEYFDGYIQDLRVYKGVAKYKGGFDVPKPYTPVGIATWRAVPDTTANNFATLNPLHHGTSITESSGNLSASWAGSGWQQVTGTIGISTGKWYWETVQTSAGSQMSGITLTGIGTLTVHQGQTTDNALAYFGGNGNIYYNSTNVSYGSTWGQNDIIGVAFNASDRKIEFYKNGTSQGIQTGYTVGIRTEGTYAPSYAVNNSGTASINFGQNPTFSGNVAAAGTFTDSNGKGLFKYQPPSGFLALCEDNLPTPAISDPGDYFKTVLYTASGNGTVVGCGFTPDLVWIKNRDNVENHYLIDSVRGTKSLLSSNSTNAQAINPIGETGTFTFGFTDNGFSINDTDTANGEIYFNNRTYAAWCWRAGAGTTSTNTDGSIQSVVSVNQDAGFSIVSYTGTGSAATVGHGLGKTPKFMLVKNRDAVSSFLVYHSYIGGTGGYNFNSTGVNWTDSTAWNNSNPTSSVINIGTNYQTSGNGNKLIAYCWAEIEGFSKAFSYVGNGSDDGPMVWLGFKPALIIIKRADAVSSWAMLDSSRSSTNPANRLMWSNLTDVEGEYTICDFLSNGIKLRNVSNGYNASGGTYIGMAFAESPFTTANAK
jgi:hypothetical protein